MDYYDCPCSLGDRLLQRRQIDLPSVVINQRVRDQRHVLQIGEKIKQRVTWLGYENFIARIRQQPKDVRISLTSAGSEDQVLRINFVGEGTRPTRVVFRYCFSRAAQAFRLRVIVERFPMARR